MAAAHRARTLDHRGSGTGGTRGRDTGPQHTATHLDLADVALLALDSAAGQHCGKRGGRRRKVWRASGAAAVRHITSWRDPLQPSVTLADQARLPSSFVEVAVTGAALQREGSVANRVRPLAVFLAPEAPAGHSGGTRAPCAREHE